MSEPRISDELGRGADRRGVLTWIVFVVIGVGFLLDELDVFEAFSLLGGLTVRPGESS